jgi:hypothetical protein
MNAREWMIDKIARGGYRLFRFLIPLLPDKVHAFNFRLIERLLYAITGDLAVKNAVGEVAGLFEAGPCNTDTIKKLMKPDESDLIASAIKCLTGKSPLGAP